jgi:hypothetical protein
MGIDVVIEKEDGEAEDRVPDPHSYLATALGLPGLEGTVCLRFVDPYGNTVFNRSQIPVFISELESLRSRVTDVALREQAVQNCEAAKQARWAAEIVRKYEAAIDRAAAAQVLAHLDAILTLARRANGQVHTYIKCYGD